MKNKMTRKLKWKLVDEDGKSLSRHFTKKHAQEAQRKSNKSKIYVRKI